MLVENHFRQQRKEKTEKIRQLADDFRASAKLSEIVPASVDGRIDTLFIKKGHDHYGLYDPKKRIVIEEGQTKLRHVSLFNMAAVNTLQNNGRVYLSENEEMP